jgi:hypothetical protein
MQPRILQACLRGARLCGLGAVTLGFWTLWLALGLLAVFQTYVAATRELELPGFVIREIEARLAASGLRATFGRTLFDPSGRILVEDARLELASYDEPVVTADAIYTRVRPWALIADRFEPLELRVTGLSLRVPSMLSPSGKSEEVVRDLDAEFVPDGPDVRVEYLTCRIGNLDFLARGALRLGGSRPGRKAPLPLAEVVASNYIPIIRGIGGAIGRLGSLDDPIVRATLTPGDRRGMEADLSLLASGVRLDEPVGLLATDIQASTRVSIRKRGAVPFEINLDVGGVALNGGAEASGLHARIRGTVDSGRRSVELGFVDATAAAAQVRGLAIAAPFASLEPGPLPGLRVEASGLLLGSPLAVGIDADLKAKTAYVRFQGALAPGLIDTVSARAGRDLRKWVEPGSPVEISGGAEFGPGWKFERVTSRVATHRLRIRAVTLDDASGRVDFDGSLLSAPEALVRSGENLARGSYSQDIATGRYRFLLEGGLRPLEISSWFPKWWPALFGNFAFPAEVPAASVDLQGHWRDKGRSSLAFVQVDSARPVIRGASLDRVRTILFVRPLFLDGIEVRAGRGAGAAEATFSRRTTPGPHGTHHLEFEATSSLDPRDMAGLLGQPGAVAAAHLVCARPPVVRVKGSADLPKAPGGPGGVAHVQVQSEGPFTLFNWPLDHLALAADLHDDDLKVEPVTAAFAGGTAAGRVEIKGTGADRRVSFSASCRNASLGQAVVAAEGFVAERKRARPRAASTFLGDRANVHLNLDVTADGRYGDPLSYHGGGEASLEGPELGEVRMLGLLSDLLKFTSLRFTSAHGDFRIDGRQLVFPNIKVTGANSGIDAHGSYSLDRHELDIKAKIYPFGQSKLLPEMLVGAVLAPLSDVFEMRLTGSVEKPSWSLAKVYKPAPPAQAAAPKAPAPAAPPAR